jgi:hypothetical protein
MPPEVKTRDDQPSSMMERAQRRLRPSNDQSTADEMRTFGNSPLRTVHSVHKSGHQGQHGNVKPGEKL